MYPGQITRPGDSPVPADFLDRAETVTHAVAELAQRFPDYECLTILDRHWKQEGLTLGGLWSRAKAIQATLEARGLRRGDAVVLVLPTGSELLAAYIGVMIAGGIPALASMPTNRVSDPSLYLALLGAILRNAEARALYTADEVVELVTPSRAGVLGDAQLLCPGDVDPLGSGGDAIRARGEDLATIQYSSGTTGSPKGVMLSHRAMLDYMRMLRAGIGLRTDEVSVNWLPLYHDMGLFGAFLMPLLCGCPSVLIPTADFVRMPALWLQAIHAFGGAISWAPNFAYSMCTQRIPDDELEGLSLASWRVAISASEPVLAPTIAAFADRFAPYGFRPETMTPSYGLAEAVMAIAIHPVDETPRVDVVDRASLARDGRAVPSPDGASIVAAGQPLPYCEIEIRDVETRRPLPDREVGQIWVRASCLCEGYRGDPDRTAKTLVDGWLDTGDRGYQVDGDLYFVSRAKDLIVIGGEKYAPHDVEMAINRVPGVREGCAAAFGVPNEKLGTEELGAVIETRTEAEGDLDALAHAVRLEVSRTLGLGIRHIHLVPPGGITKTTSGKLAREATRDRYPEVFGRGR